MKPWLLTPSLVIACATGGASGSGEFEQDLGVATEVQLKEMTHKVLALHRFEIEREMDSPSIYIETRWLSRRPFEDEQSLGVDAAQVRVMVRGRPRSATNFVGETYSASIRIDQQVRMLGGTEWTQQTFTEGARAYADRIVADLKRELDVGVRRH